MTKGQEKTTIGQEAEAKAAEYFKIYNDLKNDKNLAHRAKGLATHDLRVEGIINRMAQEKLATLIEGVRK